VDASQLEKIRQRFAGPMSNAEADVLRDIHAFIDFAMHNGLSFAFVMGALAHDSNGFARFGFDLEAATADGFKPKVSGYAHINAASVGESEEPAD